MYILICAQLTIADASLCNRLYNNIVAPSQLPQKANYYLFKVRTRISLSMCLSGSR